MVTQDYRCSKNKMKQYMMKFSFHASGQASEYFFGLEIYKESFTNSHLCHYYNTQFPYTIHYSVTENFKLNPSVYQRLCKLLTTMTYKAIERSYAAEINSTLYYCT